MATQKQKQKRQMKSKRLISLFEITLMLTATIAFAFILNASFVNAIDATSIAQTFFKKDVVVKPGGAIYDVSTGSQLGTINLETGAISSGSSTSIGGAGSTAPGPTGSSGWGNVVGKVYGGNVFSVTEQQFAANPTKYAGYTKGANGMYYSNTGFYGGALLAGVAWAATAYVAVKMIGSWFGLSSGMQTALQYSLTSGAFVAGTLNSLGTNAVANSASTGFWADGGGGALFSQNPFISGLVVAAIVFVLTYKEESKKTVTFTCFPWEAPTGGANCEQCNKDSFRPCSEYRCKSLGQACQILNSGTTEERCAWVNPKDVTSPTIEAWDDALTSGYSYTPNNALRPSARGVKVVNKSSSTTCVKPFTPLKFGIILNEPAKCKLDYSRPNATGKTGFDSLQFYFGGSNYYRYNHTQTMRLPGVTNETESPILTNGNTMNLYVRCMDANGNVNEDDYVFTFCVDDSPDTTPPMIEGTSISNGGFVQYNVDHVPIEVYTNEPAKCKWSRVDKDYKDMENNMTCASSTADVNNDLTFTCSGNLTAIKNSETNNFYFRCKDYPDKYGEGNNEMQQSYKFTLMGSQPLKISSVTPNGTIRGNTEVVPVSMQVKTTSGAEEGKALCYYSPTGLTNSYILMYDTANYVSTQTLDLIGSSIGTNYTYYIRCVDAGGNMDNTVTSFSLFVDKDAPIVTRVYKEVPDALKVITSEDATCAYSLTSCNFNITEGQQLIPVNDVKNVNAAEWKSNAIYYIKCQDEYGNNPGNDCSIIVNAVELATRAQ